ncbi:MAG: circadian clock KaiB family protein, partial [Verrucomicrobiae bacterium]
MKIKPGGKDDTAAFEKALAQTGAGRYVLTLYVTGTSQRSIQSIDAIKSLCEQHLRGRYDLEVVDLYQQPRKAKDDQIFAAPTLIKKLPPPYRLLIEQMSDGALTLSREGRILYANQRLAALTLEPRSVLALV